MIIVFSVIADFIYIKLDEYNRDISVGFGGKDFYTVDEMLSKLNWSKPEVDKVRRLQEIVRSAQGIDAAKQMIIKDLESDGAKYLKTISEESYKSFIEK